jgi:hypothetical protein
MVSIILIYEIDIDSEKTAKKKVVDNFETFSESTNTTSYDPQFRSYGFCKLLCCWNLFLGRTRNLDEFGI